jgi:MFS family permease
VPRRVIIHGLVLYTCLHQPVRSVHIKPEKEFLAKVFCTAATPASGTFSDIFGRKPILLAANIAFFVGSLICALAINTKMLIGGRVVQGLGGGAILTLVNICIGDLFSVRYEATITTVSRER